MLQEVRKHLQSAAQREKEILKLSGHSDVSYLKTTYVFMKMLKKKIDSKQAPFVVWTTGVTISILTATIISKKMTTLPYVINPDL